MRSHRRIDIPGHGVRVALQAEEFPSFRFCNVVGQTRADFFFEIFFYYVYYVFTTYYVSLSQLRATTRSTTRSKNVVDTYASHQSGASNSQKSLILINQKRQVP